MRENRHGLIVAAQASPALGPAAEGDSAVERWGTLPGFRRQTVGADKGYDTARLVTRCRGLGVTAHVVRKAKGSALDGRTLRHAG